MTLNSHILISASVLLFLIGFSLVKLFKSKKRSAESIYKLIDDLEKKYIY